MQIHDRIAKDLNSILGKKFDKLTIANEQAVSTIDPTQGRIFTLDYTAAGKSYGSVTVNIVNPDSLVIYYNTDIAEDMRYDDKKDWYNFLKELRYFAKRNLMNFDVRNIGKQQLDKKDYAYIKTNDVSYESDEITMESKLHGGVKTSYQNFGEATLVIKHKKSVEEEKHGARTRQIHSMYIENSSKERTRIPFNYLAGARALAQHVNQGGSVDDEMGQHIIEMIQEVIDLKKFVKTFRRADNFASDDAYKIIEQARQRAQGLGATLKTLAGPKGYGSYVEQYEPTEEFIEQADLDDIRTKLVRIEKDNIVDTVLPSLARGIKAMEINENALTALANDDSAKLELLPNPEEDQDIKDYIEYVKSLKKSGRKTSEDPMDGLVNRIILTLTKRGTDELHSALANLNIDRPADKVTAYKLAGKYLRGMIDYVSPKAKKAKKTEAEELESWANDLVEGTWAIPDTDQKIDALEELMKEELPVGADANNAMSAIADIIGDDQLFDDLEDLASNDPESDARPTIKEWIKSNIGRYEGMPADLKERVMGMLDEGYSVLPNIDSERYGERSGLEGPFRAKNGKVVYYDKAEGKYYDPDTDMYIDYDDYRALDEANISDEDWVHINRVGSFYNPQKDTIVGYSKSPKDPNRAPKLKSGANSALRISDAKKKGYTIKEAYRAPTQAEIDADKKKDNRGKSRSSMSAKSATSNVYKNMMGSPKKEAVDEGGFFDPDQPNPGDMVKHSDGTVGKVTSISTQGDETWVNFKSNDGEMYFGQWKKHVFPMDKVEEASSKLRESEPGQYRTIGGVRYYIVKNKSGNSKAFSGPTPAAKKYAQSGGNGLHTNENKVELKGFDPRTEGLVNDVMKKGIDDLMKKEIRKMFNKSAGDEGAIEMIAKKLQIPADDVKRLLDEDARVLDMLKLAGIESQQVDEYNSELSMMANSYDRVERTYGQVLQGVRGRGPADDSEVGDFIPRGMTGEEIRKLIDMLANKGYDKDFLLKDLAPMMEEVVDEAEVDESIQYMYSLKDKGMSIEEIAKELGMKPEEVEQAMAKTESTIEESHTDYDDSKKIADKDGVEIYAYDTDDEGSAIEVYVNGTEVATGYSDLLAGDMVIDGKSFSSKEDVIAHYKEVTDELGETAELEEMKQRLLKLAGMA